MGKHGHLDGLGIGATMKKMGYKTVFWYGGLRSWQDIEHFMGTKVYLQTWVKVKENWIDDAGFLHTLGLGAQ